MGRYLLILGALVWLTGTGAFFLYVPFFSVISCGLVVIGLGVMFILGVHVGSSLETSATTEGRGSSFYSE